ACAQVQLMPAPAESDLDFRDAFDSDPGPFTEASIGGFKVKHYTSPKYDLSLVTVDSPSATFGSMLGEFWVAYGDWASDTNGKMRLTPNMKATLPPDTFLHATMQAHSVP